MTCDNCGDELAAFHLNFSNETEGKSFRYCEDCFVTTFQRPDLVQKMKAIHEGKRVPQPQIEMESDSERFKKSQAHLLEIEPETHRESLKESFSARFDELHARAPRFSIDAYVFVYMAMFFSQRKTALSQKAGGWHISARELVEAGEEYARDTFGTLARSELKSWGLETASDIGDIVFLLVENKMLGKTPEDNRSDFDGLPFLTD